MAEIIITKITITDNNDCQSPPIWTRKTCRGEESLHQQSSPRKSLPPVEILKFGKQVFKLLFFKIKKKIVFQILSLEQEANFLWRRIVVNSLPPPPQFL